MPWGYAAAAVVGAEVLGGSGGGGGSQQQGTQVNDIPDWLKPDVQDVIGKSKALAETPYEAYKGERTAGLTDMQKQAMNTASSPEAFGKSVQGYMNPYMQNVVDVQQRKAREQAGINANTMQARAAQTGAFGGSGAALQRAAMDRGLQTQLGDIQKQGLEAAYGQGVAQANKAEGQQWLMGGAEQQLEQKKLDTAYQEFLNKKNDPYQKIGFQSNVIRGLPTGSTRTDYLPAPTMAQNMMGFGMGMNGLNQMGVFADGGEVKSYKGGGLSDVASTPYHSKLDDVLEAHYGKAKEKNDRSAMRDIENEQAIRQYLQTSIEQGAGGDPGYLGQRGLSDMQGVTDMPSYSGETGSVVRALNDSGALMEEMSSLSDDQLKQILQHPATKAEFDAAQAELAQRASDSQGLSSAFNTLPEDQQEGIISAAGGGILAFGGGGDTDEDGGGGGTQYAEAPSAGNPALYRGITALYPQLLQRAASSTSPTMSDADYDRHTERELEKYRKAAGPSQYERIQSQLAEMQGDEEAGFKQAKGLASLIAAERAVRPGQTNMQAFLGMSSEYGKQYAQAAQANRTAKRKLQEMDINLADAKRKEDLGLYKEARTSADNARRDQSAAAKAASDRDFKIANLATSMARTVKPTGSGAGGAGGKEYIIGPAELLPQIQQEHPDWTPEQHKAEARREYMRLKSAGLAGVETKVEQVEQTEAGKRYDQGLIMRSSDIRKAQKAGDSARVEEIRDEVAKEAGYKRPRTAPPAPTGGAPLYASNAKGDRIVSTDNGKTWKPVGAP